jgi:hypothetical protein
MSKFFAALAWVGIWIALCGCASQSSAPATGSRAGAPVESDLNVSQAPAGDSGMPVPPQGAQYTLHCSTFNGPDHVMASEQAKQALVKMTQSNEWYIVHSDQESDLYYGFYKTFDDRSQLAEFTRAQSDRAKIASLLNEQGDPIFPEAGFAPIDTPNPRAPKEWDLSSNPGFWTLQIAVYKGNPLRKQAAVDAVKGFRAHGIEAYFRHGPQTSEVYIGSWPRGAIAEQESTSAQGDDPDEPLLVLSGAMQGADSTNFYTPDGRKMRVVEPKLQILDPTLLKATQDYPYFYVNGIVIGRRAQMPDRTVKLIPWPSYLIQVPHDNDNNQEASPDKPETDPGQPSDSGGAMPVDPGLGGLRPGG